MQEIEAVTGVPKKEIGRMFKLILPLSTNDTVASKVLTERDFKSMIPRFACNLNLDYKVREGEIYEI